MGNSSGGSSNVRDEHIPKRIYNYAIVVCEKKKKENKFFYMYILFFYSAK